MLAAARMGFALGLTMTSDGPRGGPAWATAALALLGEPAQVRPREWPTEAAS